MPQPDRVVVVGGAGFIGKHLTEMLAESGCHVVVVGRKCVAGPTSNSRIEYQAGDVADRRRLSELFAGASVVYDLSLPIGTTWEDWQRGAIQGAVNVAEACLEHRVRRLIYTSTTAALYLGRAGVASESSLGNEAAFEDRGGYSRAKSICENKLLKFHRDESLPVIIFRPAVVMGPGGNMVHPALGDRVSDLCIMGWGLGTTPLPFVLVDDVARALLLARDAPGIEGETFNLVGDVRPSATEFVSVLRTRSHRNFRFYPRPMWKILGAEYGRYCVKKIAGKARDQKVLARDLKSSSLITQLDCSLAKQKLGWTPVSDRDEFFRQAVDCFINPLHPGDVRLEAAD